MEATEIRLECALQRLAFTKLEVTGYPAAAGKSPRPRFGVEYDQ